MHYHQKLYATGEISNLKYRLKKEDKGRKLLCVQCTAVLFLLLRMAEYGPGKKKRIVFSPCIVHLFHTVGFFSSLLKVWPPSPGIFLIIFYLNAQQILWLLC